jgi:hypothetical protein
MNIITQMNNYLSDGKNFADVIQGIILFLVLFIGVANVTGNFQYAAPLLYLIIILPILLVVKIVLWDCEKLKKPLPNPDGIPLILTFVLASLMSMCMAAAPGILAKSDLTGDAFELLSAAFIAIGGLCFMFAIYVVKYTPFFRYNQPCPHCEKLYQGSTPVKVSSNIILSGLGTYETNEPKKIDAVKVVATIKAEQPKPAPKVEPKAEPTPAPAPKKTAEKLPDIFAASSIEDLEYADLV